MLIYPLTDWCLQLRLGLAIITLPMAGSLAFDGFCSLLLRPCAVAMGGVSKPTNAIGLYYRHSGKILARVVGRLADTDKNKLGMLIKCSWVFIPWCLIWYAGEDSALFGGELTDWLHNPA